jgi:hypothetical protein
MTYIFISGSVHMFQEFVTEEGTLHNSASDCQKKIPLSVGMSCAYDLEVSRNIEIS